MLHAARASDSGSADGAQSQSAETDPEPADRGSPSAEPSALFATDDNPVPEGAVSGHFDGQDLTLLRFARWEPLVLPARGTVCLFTGRAEFIEKYFETVTDLRRRGFHVTTMDWRGQGGSARMLGNPRKGHVTTFDQYLADVDLFMRAIVLPDCPGPYFALAHSMGGNIIIQTLAMRGQWFDRAVVAAPMLDLWGRGRSVRTLRRLTEIACYVGLAAAFVPGGRSYPPEVERFDDNPFTSDRRRFERNLDVLRIAPRLGIGSPTVGWLHAATRAMEVVVDPEFAARLRVPLLMVAAGNDRIVSTRVTETIGRGLRSGGCVVVDGAQHEILQERPYLREQFWAAFDAFVPGGD